MGLYKKIKRKFLKVWNNIQMPDGNEVVRLTRLTKYSPTHSGSADEWCDQYAELLQTNVLNRIAKEDLACIIAGIVSYRNTGVTPRKAHTALVRAYENTCGQFQDILHKILFQDEPVAHNEISSDIFGALTKQDLHNIVEEISESGYAILPLKLDKTLIEKLRVESLGFEYFGKGGDAGGGMKLGKINPEIRPRCVSAYAMPESLRGSALFQNVCNDPILKYIASSYLGSDSNAIDSTLWYSFPSSQASSDAAQLFHYDLDTLRWLKVFIYLNDIGLDNGPHEYVPATHKPEMMSHKIMRREYGRIADSEIDACYGGKRKVLCAAAGTVVFGDTRCFHKGRVVNEGYRQIFVPIYAPSTLGYFHGYI